MPEIKWIKLTTDMFDDEKIRLIEAMPDSDTLLVIWVKLLCQAGKVNANGYIFLAADLPFTDENLATLFNRPLNTIRLALTTFRKLNMIEIDDRGLLWLPNWSKHQSIEGMDRIRQLTKARVEKYRGKQKLLPLSNQESKPVTLHCVTVTQTEVEGEREVEVDKNKSSSKGGLGGNETAATEIIKKYYLENYGTITPAVREQLTALCQEYPIGWVHDALQEGVNHGKTNLAYIKAILKAWKANGHPTTRRSVSAAPASSKERNPEPEEPDKFLDLTKYRGRLKNNS